METLATPAFKCPGSQGVKQELGFVLLTGKMGFNTVEMGLGSLGAGNGKEFGLFE